VANDTGPVSRAPVGTTLPAIEMPPVIGTACEETPAKSKLPAVATTHIVFEIFILNYFFGLVLFG
jgi:hypothetical protein